MGYRGHDDWHDMSDYVVHFKKPIDLRTIAPPAPRADPERSTLVEMLAEIHHVNQQDRTGYHPWIDILGGRELKDASMKSTGPRRGV